MAVNLVRYARNGATHWGVVSPTGISPLQGAYPTTAALIEGAEADWRAAQGLPATVPLASVEVLSPVTTPCRIYCQGANYRQHMIESGMDPDAKQFNMFFTKSDASVSSAIGTVRPPRHVRLLDYEVELALVFRRPISAAATVTSDTLKDYVFAITIANDLSARDVQLPEPVLQGKTISELSTIQPTLLRRERAAHRHTVRLCAPHSACAGPAPAAVVAGTPVLATFCQSPEPPATVFAPRRQDDRLDPQPRRQDRSRRASNRGHWLIKEYAGGLRRRTSPWPHASRRARYARRLAARKTCAPRWRLEFRELRERRGNLFACNAYCTQN